MYSEKINGSMLLIKDKIMEKDKKKDNVEV
jgi:hypothetical protein